MQISSADATEVIASCGYSIGYAYFIAGGFVPTDQAGWRKEDVSSQLLLVRKGSDYDVLKITGSRMTTAASQGAKISVLAQRPDAIILVAVYPGLFERFIFQILPATRSHLGKHSMEFYGQHGQSLSC